MEKAEVFRTYEGRRLVLVEQVIDGERVDRHLVRRSDLKVLRWDLGDKEAARRMATEDIECGGIPYHTKIVEEWVGKSVNWTGGTTESGYEFVMAK